MKRPHPGSRGAIWVWTQSVLLAALVASGPLASPHWHHPAGVTLGIVLFVAAAALGVPAVVHLGRNRTPFPQPRPGSVLVAHGWYAYMRHPLYLSVLVAAWSWTFLWQNAWTAGLSVLTSLFFDAKARQEERYLAGAFPGYQAYARRVCRFIPGLY